MSIYYIGNLFSTVTNYKRTNKYGKQRMYLQEEVIIIKLNHIAIYL